VFELAASADFGATEFAAACNYDQQKEHVSKIKRPPLQRLKRHKSYAHNMTGAQLYGMQTSVQTLFSVLFKSVQTFLT